MRKDTPDRLDPVDHSSCVLFDVLLERESWRMAVYLVLAVLAMLLVAFMLIVLAGLFIALTNKITLSVLLALGIFALFAILLIGAYDRHLYFQVGYAVDGAQISELPERLRQLCRQRVRIRHRELLEWFTQTLTEAGCGGVTFRVQYDTPFETIDPINVPFEPIPVDESAPAFVDLCSAVDEDPMQLSKSSGANSFGEDTEFVRRLWRKFSFIYRGTWSIVALILLIASARSGSLKSGLIVLGVMLLSILTGSATRGGWKDNEQWFLVPGGIAVRTLQRSARAWDIHLFVRQQSVLSLYRSKQRFWYLFIADSEERKQVQITRAEARMLLRAWLSPLPPPAPDRLSALE